MVYMNLSYHFHSDRCMIYICMVVIRHATHLTRGYTSTCIIFAGTRPHSRERNEMRKNQKSTDIDNPRK